MNFRECMEYTADVANRLPNLPEQKKRRFLKAADRIWKRAGNPYLHVALIGDFSAGKSTFINAFVKKDILKTAWQATTAVPTYIYYHDREKMRIIVETSDGEKYRLDNDEQCGRLEKKLDIRLPEDAKDVMAFLSTSNGFADRIRRIGIWVPGLEELRHVCIIDTPGVNPGAEEAASHVARTQEVLRENADATIVLFQETQVFSGSFRKFLEENAGRFMDDAVFVITMMDLAEEKDREGLMEYVRMQLKQAFGTADPLVFGCCAKAVVSGKSDSESRYWTESFDRMREQIIRYMSDRRKRMVQKQLSFLLENLVVELDREVADALSAIEQRRENLEKTSAANTTDRYERYREYLFTKEKMELQIRRHQEMHRKLLEYDDELKSG